MNKLIHLQPTVSGFIGETGGIIKRYGSDAANAVIFRTKVVLPSENRNSWKCFINNGFLTSKVCFFLKKSSTFLPYYYKLIIDFKFIYIPHVFCIWAK